mmetsp:Transcript_20720/g.82696  ORF Transcript_20720/g.82696 Transcript_20720/m.82696 type:complete len:283 (+) Transcript_20720:424-1272(+)
MRARSLARTRRSAPCGVCSAKTPCSRAAATLWASSSARNTSDLRPASPKRSQSASICAFLSPSTSDPSAHRGRSASSPSNSKRGSKWSAGVEMARPCASSPSATRSALSTTSRRPNVAMATLASRSRAVATKSRNASASTKVVARSMGIWSSGVCLKRPQTWNVVSVQSKSKIASAVGGLSAPLLLQSRVVVVVKAAPLLWGAAVLPRMPPPPPPPPNRLCIIFGLLFDEIDRVDRSRSRRVLGPLGRGEPPHEERGLPVVWVAEAAHAALEGGAAHEEAPP